MFWVIIPIQTVLLPHLYGNLLRHLQTATKNAFRKTADVLAVKTDFLWVVVVLILAEVASYLLELFESHLFTTMQNFVRTSAFQTLLHNTKKQADDVQTGDAVIKFAKLAPVIDAELSITRSHIVPALMTFVVGAVYAWHKDKMISASLFGFGIMFFLVVWYVPRACSTTSMVRDATYNHMIERMDDVLRNLSSVHSQGMVTYEKQHIWQMGTAYGQRYIETAHCYLKTHVIVTLASVLLIVLFIVRGAVLSGFQLFGNKQATAKSSSFDVGNFVTLIMIMTVFLSTLGKLTWITRVLTINHGTLSESSSVLDSQSSSSSAAGVDCGHTQPVPTHYVGFGCINVMFKYASATHPTLDNVSLHISWRQGLVVFWGDVGSGKSTLLKLLAGLLQPTCGDVYIDNRFHRDMDSQIVRKRIAYVPQQAILFDRTVMENVMYGNTAHTQEVFDLFQKMGFERMVADLPEGIHSKVGKNGSRLSGGQRQIVMCIRALLRKPDALLMDEPTAAMDETTKHALRGVVLDSLRSNRTGTIVMVTHDPFFLKIADRVIHIRRGKVVNDELASGQQ